MSTIDDFGTITLTSKSVSQQGISTKGASEYKSALIRNIDGASAAWGANWLLLVLALVFAAAFLWFLFQGLSPDNNEPEATFAFAGVFALFSYMFYNAYQRSKMCVLKLFAGQMTITDRINAQGIGPAIDFIDALERAQLSE